MTMKFTCLSEGKGYHFPPCHILEICGFRILLDCPLDLSALTIFSPIPSASRPSSIDTDYPKCLNHSGPLDQEEPLVQKRQKVEEPVDADDLIYAEPWYKTVGNLHLWNTSFIDVVLISSPMGMLGLPFLTRTKGFSAKIYVTEATARIGQLLMDDLVSMHMEIRQLLGPEESSLTQWMKWEELKLLHPALRHVALGKDGGDLGSWMPIYSAEDVRDCMQKTHKLRFAEETCYNSALIIKAFSSGLEIGSCNWRINSPKGGVTFISRSIFGSSYAMNFDYMALHGNDAVIYSDFSSLDGTEDVGSDHDNFIPSIHDPSPPKNVEDDGQEWAKSVLQVDDNMEEMQKLAFLSTHAIDSVKAGGSVLIPVSRLGIVLQLLEQISALLDVSDLKIPIYIISSIGEELLAFTNTVPEWLSKKRQDKLFSGQPLFKHVELMNEGKLHVFPAIHSPKLLMNWQEPCIVFSSHWSLRLGPSVHLLRRWCGDPNSLLILDNELDVELAVLPFKPMAMKVLQCSFLSGIRLLKIQPLLNILQPKVLLVPKDLKLIDSSKSITLSIFPYYPDETLCLPSPEDKSELAIATHLALHFDWRKLKQGDISITRLKGELFSERGKQHLISGKVHESSEIIRPLVHWGSPDLERLLTALSNRSIRFTVLNASEYAENVSSVLVSEPSQALIEVKESSTVITAACENLASLIFEVVGSILDGI